MLRGREKIEKKKKKIRDMIATRKAGPRPFSYKQELSRQVLQICQKLAR